jgi:hypothetical protein
MARPVTGFIQNVGTGIFFIIVGVFSVWVLSSFFEQLQALRDAPGDRQASLVRNPKKFWVGLVGLAVFFVVLGVWLSPISDGKTGIQLADQVFNEFAKNSANYLADAKSRLPAFGNTTVDFGITPKDAQEGERILSMMRANNLTAVATGDGRVRITGNLGQFASQAVADAELVYYNQASGLQEKYKLDGSQVVSAWWAVFNGLSRRYTQESKAVEADFTKVIATKVLEPAYNFRGIQPRNISDHAPLMVLFLGFYVIYTIWYGFSIMYLFEGLGIGSHQKTTREEH